MYYIVPITHFTNPHNTKMLDTNGMGDDSSQSFETTRKHDCIATAQIFHVTLRSDLLQFQHNITHNITCEKLPSSVK